MRIEHRVRCFTCAFAISAPALSLIASTAKADPCGMVPPVSVPAALGQEPVPPIARVGAQKTYVFYRKGIETLVIRPGFEGRVEEFGMLIPFPTPPEIRKVPDAIFAHVATAVDPPQVEIDLRPQFGGGFGGFGGGGFGGGFGGAGLGVQLKPDEVRVVREEAVGMYEVAVLQAGGAAALKRWMTDHGYRFPDGMEDVCNDYVRQRWSFVAVRTKVGRKKNVDPKPGMRQTDPDLPKGSVFDGHVQAMGFRFRSRRLEVPMRLSAFNAGKLHNIVYVLTDEPVTVRGLPSKFVVRQISGRTLEQNLTQLLPVRILGARIENQRIVNLTKNDLKQYEKERDPAPHNGLAKELFMSDLVASQEQRLSHPIEDHEKMLLRIGERLELRGPEIDGLHREQLERQRDETFNDRLAMLRSLTLTVIDGEFPREFLAARNLLFTDFRMRSRLNTPRFYDARTGKPAKKKEGILLETVSLTNLPEAVATAAKQNTGRAENRADKTSMRWLAGLLLPLVVLIGGGLAFRRAT